MPSLMLPLMPSHLSALTAPVLSTAPPAGHPARPSQRPTCAERARPPSAPCRPPRPPRPANERRTRSGAPRVPAAVPVPKLSPPGAQCSCPGAFRVGTALPAEPRGSEPSPTVPRCSQLLRHLHGQGARGLAIRTFRRDASGSCSSPGRRGPLCVSRAGEEGDYRSRRAARVPLSSLALRWGRGFCWPRSGGIRGGVAMDLFGDLRRMNKRQVPGLRPGLPRLSPLSGERASVQAPSHHCPRVLPTKGAKNEGAWLKRIHCWKGWRRIWGQKVKSVIF